MMKKGGMMKHVTTSPLDVTLHGSLDFQLGARSQPSKYTKNAGDNAVAPQKIGVSKHNNNLAFDTEGLVTLKAKGQHKELDYGANMTLTSYLISSNSNKYRKDTTYIYMHDKDMGCLELGNKEGASEMMMPTASDVAAATGGIAGDWYKYVRTTTFQPNVPNVPTGNMNTLVTPDSFYAGSGSLLDNGTGVSSNLEKTRKVTYYTPELKNTGIRFGISYIPDSQNASFFNDIANNNTTNAASVFPNNNIADSGIAKGYQNGVVAGLSWKHSMNKDNHFKAAITGEYATLAKSLKSNYSNLGTVGVGASYMYKDFSFAGSYVYVGKSGLRKDTTEALTAPYPTNGAVGQKVKKNNFIATLGAAYKVDSKTRVSLTSLFSSKSKNTFWDISLGAQYKLAPGLMPYAEITWFQMRQKYSNVANKNKADDTALPFAQLSSKNRGAAFILGAKVQF